jgi:amino acid transporter
LDQDFVINYILLPVFVILVVGYKFWRRTKWVKVEDNHLWTGRREYSEDELADKLKNSLWTRVKKVVIG